MDIKIAILGLILLLFLASPASATINITQFNSSGWFNISSDTVIEYLVVAGGGGGGSATGGGGAGGVLYNVSYTLPTGNYYITVGAGGLGNTGGDRGANGTNSSIGSLLVAIGGGGGAGYTAGQFASDGGSGGGGANGDASGAAGTVGQGNAGGLGQTAGGGGGGKNTTGKDRVAGDANGGAGGDGFCININGTFGCYAGGGGGGGYSGTGGAGANSSGGRGGDSGLTDFATQGVNGTGGGGGGGGAGGDYGIGKRGGNGVVVIKYTIIIDLISWGNNYTNNQDLSISVPQNTVINFNITNNSVAADYYNTTVNGIDQSNNFNNFTLTASSLAGYAVTLSATNLTYSTSSKTWIVSVTAPSYIGGEGQITSVTNFTINTGVNITINPTQNFTQITLFNSSETPPNTLQFLINGSRIRFNSSSDKNLSSISYYPSTINGSRGWNFTLNSGAGNMNTAVNVAYPAQNYSIYRDGTLIEKVLSNVTGWLFYNISGAGNYSIQRNLGKPYLITPANNSDIATTQIDFTWSNESSAQYNIQVARDSAFSIIDADTNVATNSTSIEVLFLTNYYWRVRTYDGVATYGEWSEPFTFEATTYTLPASDGSTGIHGYVFEVKTTGNVRIANAIVSISNTTWTSATTTDSNGYYLFKNLANNTLYTLQATKPNYENSATELVTTVNGTWAIKHIYMQACVSGLNCFYTQEYQTAIVYYTNTSPVLDATVTIYRDSAEVENKLTDSSGATKFLLTKDVRYQATVTKLSEGILHSEFFYTSPNPLIIIVGTPTYTIPNATPHPNITTYNQTSTTKAWSVQNFTSQYLTSQIGLGTMGQGILVGTVNWVVVGAGGWFTTILTGAIMAYLGILAWTTVIFFILTILSLWVLTRT